MRRKPSRMPTGRLQSLRLFSTLLPIALRMVRPGVLSAKAFYEKAGRSQVDSCLFLLGTFSSSRRVATVAMLPSALSRSDSFRSVHVGRSRFSRCCHLFGALWFCSWRVEPGPGHRRSHRNSALAFVFPLPGTVLTLFCLFVLRDRCHRRSAAVVQRFVCFSVHPEMMQ